MVVAGLGWRSLAAEATPPPFLGLGEMWVCCGASIVYKGLQCGGFGVLAFKPMVALRVLGLGLLGLLKRQGFEGPQLFFGGAL